MENAICRKEVARMAVKAKDKNAGAFCAYIGPSVRGVIQHGTIFEGSKRETIKSDAVRSAVERYPEIADLIVSGEVLAEARIKINTPGSLLAQRRRALAVKMKED